MVVMKVCFHSIKSCLILNTLYNLRVSIVRNELNTVLLLQTLHTSFKNQAFNLCALHSKSIVYTEERSFKIGSSLENEFSNINLIKLIKRLLKCSVKEANVLYQNNYDFIQLNSAFLGERIKVLEVNGILLENIKDNFWILTYDKVELQSRMKLFSMWQFTDPNNGISILNLPFKKLLKYSKQTEIELRNINGMNRITYFASLVQCDENRACKLFMKYTFMMSLKLKIMAEIINITKEVGVTSEDLLHYLWLFRYSPQFISNRISRLEQIRAIDKCKPMKPWMLCCAESTLNKFLERKDENIAALGSYSNLRDLLSNELGLSADNVDDMIYKHPPLARISYSKAKDMIDFLKTAGFSSDMIYVVPRVLCHKQATLMARMAELKKFNPNLINLHNLCRNKKDYVAFLNKLSV